MIAGESALKGASPASSGTHRATGSSRPSRPSSRNEITVAAVKLFVIEAMRNTLSASGVDSTPTRSVPSPR